MRVAHSRTEHRGKMRKRRKMRRALLIVMIAALCGAFSIAFLEVYDMWQARTLQQELEDLYRPQTSGLGWLSIFGGTALAEEVTTEEPAAEGEPIGETADETVFAEELEIQEDFLPLYEKNEDIIGWLTAGETIDYPVVQRDNEYYLDHNFYGRRDSNGTVFLNEYNVIYPRDTILLIHGHNMKSGAMFGRLARYADEAYMREHAIITFRTIYDPEDVYYIPVAGFHAAMIPEAKGYFDVTPMIFAMEEDHVAYLNEIQKRSLWESPVDVTTEDSFIMLLTCSYQNEDGRFLLICRQLREDETKETVRELFVTHDGLE